MKAPTKHSSMKVTNAALCLVKPYAKSVAMAQTSASTLTMNRTRTKPGVSMLFFTKPWTNHESIPTNGMRVRISAKRHQVKKMPGNIVSVVENLRGSQRWCWRLEMESRNG